ncbi:hypothetical protein [Rathayibacter sp. VKM Ac-2630]|uniref:hypothetical protein n=1 Tax=Rathayibacter sp. VKM Ac-2630 TaxID=1938617 RepID=UPI000982545A|nr:hypothetical protein [Rathayibacter sp. VKM Ac-2630]OOB90308.1 hypothetical protein B0T42_12470 [Rathayibacter sp. VKM Ac-2630]
MTTTAQRIDHVHPGLSEAIRAEARRQLHSEGTTDGLLEQLRTDPISTARPTFMRHLRKFLAEVSAEFAATRALVAAAIAGYPESTWKTPIWSENAIAQVAARAAARVAK